MNDNHIISPQNIEIPLPESEYIVRQDRKTLQIGEAYLEINRKYKAFWYFNLFESMATNSSRGYRS